MRLFRRKPREVAHPADRAGDSSRKVAHPADSGGDSSRRERAVRTQVDVQPALLAGDEGLQVVGESFRQENLRHLTGYPPPEKYVEQEIRAVLVAEKDNPYDPNAIAVWIKDLQAGYLHCARPEYVEDLRKRAARYRAKLGPT
jgi:hypothetical protein